MKKFENIVFSNTEPSTNSLWIKENILYFYSNGTWKPLGSDTTELEIAVRNIIYNDSEIIDSLQEIEEFLKGIDNGESLIALLKEIKDSIPNKISQLENDNKYINEEEFKEGIQEELYEPDTNGYEYVDMGEAGIWAKYPIGVSDWNTCYDDILYFTWGGIEGHKSSEVQSGDIVFNGDLDRFCGTPGYEYQGWNGSQYGATKYCQNPTYGKDGFTDNLTTLESDDDAAHINMGGSWRMPMKEEFQKLYDLCVNEWVTDYNGISDLNGWLFTLKSDNSKQLFVPASGHCYSSSVGVSNVGSNGYFWSSSLYESVPFNGLSLYFSSDYVSSQSSGPRYYGRCVVGFLGSTEKYLHKKEASQIYATKEELSNISIGIPIPKDNQVIYTTTDNQKITIQDYITKDDRNDTYNYDVASHIESHEYFEDKGYGVITMVDNEVPSFLIWYQPTVKTVALSDTFTTLGTEAIYHCDNLIEIKLGNGLTTLHYCSLANNPSLKEIVFPDSIEKLGGDNAINSVDASGYVCYQCNGLLKAVLPKSLKIIGNGLFSGCTNLTDVVIPSTVTEIGGAAFSYTALRNINIPASVVTIGNTAFAECINLGGYFDFSRVTTLGRQSFKGCKNLDTVVIGGSCVPGYNVFQNAIINKLVINSGFAGFGATSDGSHPGCQVRVIDSSVYHVTNFPTPAYCEELILRGAGIVAGLDTYIGTPNNWLKIYVPIAFMSSYKVTYPTLADYIHPITGKNALTEVNEKITQMDNDLDTLQFIVQTLDEGLGQANLIIAQLQKEIEDLKSSKADKEIATENGNIQVLYGTEIEE